jgi:flagellar biosynthesis/type III secretory pathway protein FliH
LEINTMLAESVNEWTQDWKRQGMQEGIQKGLLQGRLEGESTLLERLLAKRFGPLSNDTRARLRAARAEQLETWAERVLDAPSLAQVFGDA